MSWEILLDDAKDNILHTISNKTAENEIIAFVKSIVKDLIGDVDWLLIYGLFVLK